MTDKPTVRDPKESNDSSLLDARMLHSIRNLTEPGEGDFLDELIHLFTARSPAIIDEIREAVTRRDNVKMSRSAHSLKGSCGNLGIKKLMLCCEKIEQLGSQGRVDEAALLLEDLEQTYTLSAKELLTWKSQAQ